MPLDGGAELDLETRVSILLAEAADLIDRQGWCRGKSREGQQFCAWGAISWSAGQHEDWPDSMLVGCAANTRVMMYVGREVPSWNDLLPAATGKETVVHTLRRASGLEI